MRSSIIFVIVVSVFISLAGTVRAEEPSVLESDIAIKGHSDYVDTLLTKKHSKAKLQRRAITNYKFVEKGDFAIGFDVSYGKFDSDESQFFALLKDFSATGNSFSFNPRIAYFYKDNYAVGIKYGYREISGGVDTLTIDIDEDMDFSFHETGFDYVNSSFALLHRSYVGLDKGHRFALFNETDLAYSYGKMKYDRMLESGRNETHTDAKEVRLGINPGISVFIMDKFTVEASIGIAGLKWRKERQVTNGKKAGWHESIGMDYKFNILNIKIGIVAYL